MKTIVPDYYFDFRCIAWDCRHSCCIGWEIDVDCDTYDYYKGINGRFGDAVRKSISEDKPYHFVLDEKERCPHLNERGLCDIIINLGEEALCQICSDHPRFRNFYSDRTEMGLGLCCEAAAELVVNHEPQMKLCELEWDGDEDFCEEAEFFELRDSIFAILQNRKKPIEQRLDCVLERFGIDFSIHDIIPEFEKLEYMEDELKIAVLNLHGGMVPEGYDICFEQLAVYFVYRHLADGIYEGLNERIAFSVLSVKLIMLLCASYFNQSGRLSRKIIADFARLYSAEIEYSEDNVNAILNKLKPM